MVDSDIGVNFAGASVATCLLVDEFYKSKNALSDFMDLSDTKYKFMNLKTCNHLN